MDTLVCVRWSNEETSSVCIQMILGSNIVLLKRETSLEPAKTLEGNLIPSSWVGK